MWRAQGTALNSSKLCLYTVPSLKGRGIALQGTVYTCQAGGIIKIMQAYHDPNVSLTHGLKLDGMYKSTKPVCQMCQCMKHKCLCKAPADRAGNGPGTRSAARAITPSLYDRARWELWCALSLRACCSLKKSSLCASGASTLLQALPCSSLQGHQEPSESLTAI